MTASKSYPTFPELEYMHNCKLCMLAGAQPGLLKIAHKYARDDGLTVWATCNKMRPIFERHGIITPSVRSFGRHFSKHVDWEKAADDHEYELPDPDRLALERLTLDEASMRISNTVDLAMGNQDSDYHHMADLFSRILRRVKALDSDPTAFIDEGGKYSIQRLKIWTDMVQTSKGILEGLNKMRNSDRMTMRILEQHTHKYATSAATQVIEAVREVQFDLRYIDHPKAREIEARLAQLLDEGVSEIFTDTAVQQLQESQKEWKLLN